MSWTHLSSSRTITNSLSLIWWGAPPPCFARLGSARRRQIFAHFNLQTPRHDAREE
jgi:hypothetical protein